MPGCLVTYYIALDLICFFKSSWLADSKGRTKLEYDAVRSIHVHLDDDKSGGVDFKESKEVWTIVPSLCLYLWYSSLL